MTFLILTSPDALGVNMAEYVLGGSPMAKEMDGRLRGPHGMKAYGGPRSMVSGIIP